MFLYNMRDFRSVLCCLSNPKPQILIVFIFTFRVIILYQLLMKICKKLPAAGVKPMVGSLPERFFFAKPFCIKGICLFALYSLDSR